MAEAIPIISDDLLEGQIPEGAAPPADPQAQPQEPGSSQEPPVDPQTPPVDSEGFPLKGFLGIEADDVETWVTKAEESFQKTGQRMSDKDAYIQKLERENAQYRQQPPAGGYYNQGNQQPINPSFNPQQPQLQPQQSYIPPPPNYETDPEGHARYYQMLPALQLRQLQGQMQGMVQAGMSEFQDQAIHQATVQNSIQAEQAIKAQYGDEKLEQVQMLADKLDISMSDPYGSGRRLYGNPNVLNLLLELLPSKTGGKKTDVTKIVESLKTLNRHGNPAGGGGGGTAGESSFESDQAKLRDIDTPPKEIERIKKKYNLA